MTHLHRFHRGIAAAALLAGFATASLGADGVDGNITYRCPNNDYKNTISAKEAEKLGCKRLEGAPVTVIQTTRPRAPAVSGGTPVPAVAAAGRIDPASQRARDTDARRILENELRVEEERLSALKKDYNGGQPERQGDEKNYQRYVERVAEMSAAIARKEVDVAALKREIQKLPAPAAPPTL